MNCCCSFIDNGFLCKIKVFLSHELCFSIKTTCKGGKIQVWKYTFSRDMYRHAPLLSLCASKSLSLLQTCSKVSKRLLHVTEDALVANVYRDFTVWIAFRASQNWCHNRYANHDSNFDSTPLSKSKVKAFYDKRTNGSVCTRPFFSKSTWHRDGKVSCMMKSRNFSWSLEQHHAAECYANHRKQVSFWVNDFFLLNSGDSAVEVASLESMFCRRLCTDSNNSLMCSILSDVTEMS